MRGDSEFRRFMRASTRQSHARAIEENARGFLDEDEDPYHEMVKRRIAAASPDAFVLALCADKGNLPQKGYYDHFRSFAERRKNGRGIRVCRIFLRRGPKLEPELEKAYRQHREWQEQGLPIRGLKVDVSQLGSEEAAALARMNFREKFGYIVIHSAEWSVALTHSSEDGTFRFSEWHELDNLRHFYALFDYLLIRSDEFLEALHSDPDALDPFRELRRRTVLVTGHGQAQPPWISAEAIRESMKPIGFPGVHVIGSFSKQITFYRQQVRALNLAWAILRSEPNVSIGVIGGGIAGVTVAAAVARKVGVDRVRLFQDSSEGILRWQRDSSRLLHPHLYDWPLVDPELDDASYEHADLPILRWKAGTARSVANEIEAEWDGTGIKLISKRVDGLRRIADTYRLHTESGWYDFDILVFAIGFGAEPLAGGSDQYWNGPPVRQLHELTRIIVAGNGDGGLVDLMATTLAGFQHEKILETLKDAGLVSHGTREALRDLELDLRGLGPDFDKDCLNLWKMYEGRLGGLVESAGKLPKRKDTDVTFFPGSEAVFKRETSPLNRFVAYAILKQELAGLEPGPLTETDVEKRGPGTRIIRRFGVEPHGPGDPPPSHWRPFPEVYQACLRMREGTEVDLTDRLHPEAQRFFTQESGDADAE